MGNVEFKEDGVVKMDTSKVPTSIGKRAEQYVEILCSDPDVKRSTWHTIYIHDCSEQTEKELQDKRIFPYTLSISFKTLYPYCLVDLSEMRDVYDFSDELKKNVSRQAKYFSMILSTEKIHFRRGMGNDYMFNICVEPLDVASIFLMDENKKLKRKIVEMREKITEMEREISAMPGSEDYFAAKGRFEECIVEESPENKVKSFFKKTSPQEVRNSMVTYVKEVALQMQMK